MHPDVVVPEAPATQDDRPTGRSERKRARLDSLTGLRWFAAFAVFAHHVNGADAGGYARVPLIFPQTEFGIYGVPFFFTLSGFVLTWAWRPRDSVPQFYWRRFARIWPLHLATTVLAVPVFYWLSQVQPGWREIAVSVLLLQAWFPHIQPTFPGNPVSWSLSCEIFFYAMFPLVIRPLSRLRTRHLAVVAAVTLAAMLAFAVWSINVLDPAVSRWSLRHPVYTFGQFLVGVVLALAIRRGLRFPLPMGWAVAALAAWVLFQFNVAPHLPERLQGGVPYLRQVAVPLLCAGVIGAAARLDLDGQRSLLRWRPLVLLGAWSYAFYLVHQTVIRFALSRYGPRPESGANVFDMIGMSAVAVAVAALFYYTVEHPAERWLRRHPPRLGWARRRTAHVGTAPQRHPDEHLRRRQAPAREPEKRKS
jgi:peptidoglycan/LPS O-acetylase OafA/YrhL